MSKEIDHEKHWLDAVKQTDDCLAENAPGFTGGQHFANKLLGSALDTSFAQEMVNRNSVLKEKIEEFTQELRETGMIPMANVTVNLDGSINAAILPVDEQHAAELESLRSKVSGPTGRSGEYRHIQEVPAAVWRFTHPLKTMSLWYKLRMILGDNAEYVTGLFVTIDHEAVEIHFPTPYSGEVLLMTDEEFQLRNSKTEGNL